MNIAQIEQSVRQVLLKDDQASFIYDLLLAYGKLKSSITRLQLEGAGSYNLSKDKGTVLWKGQVFYVQDEHHTPEVLLKQLEASDEVKKHKPRFVIATNHKTIVALDTKTDERLDITLAELPSRFDFFLPWAGMEKSKVVTDNPADVKAAERMAKLYDYILVDNPPKTLKARHDLNVFLSRLLFCFFAENTGIFNDKLFSKSIESQTAKDGDDLKGYLENLFEALKVKDRADTPTYLKPFPYVNGGLFAEDHDVPVFTKRSRELLLACGLELDWSEINPDIFGSMFQAVVDVEQRGNMGMHYTSVTNIMKVIEPLFLTELYDEFAKASASQKKLQDLLQRLTRIKIFDPACGSGNFLIIAYKELRKLEMEVMNQLSVLNKQLDFGLSGIQLAQLYGIELDDFAHEIAVLSLWLAEHQMNMAFMKRFGKVAPTLPLRPSGSIASGNAHEVEWKTICVAEGYEVYILGNPPYLGSSLQSESQKADLERVAGNLNGYKKLDYIAAWFCRAADYIRGSNAKVAFVTTNSICQGEQVSILWPDILCDGIEIGFAYEAFKWANNAKKKAGVTCIIVGLRNESDARRYIFDSQNRRAVAHINAYLIDYKDIYVYGRRTPMAAISPMSYGSKPADGGFLILSAEQKGAMVQAYPDADQYLKKLIGTDEFLYGKERWCLWITDDHLQAAEQIPPIAERLQKVRNMRLASKKEPTRDMAAFPNQFGEIRFVEATSSIIVPAHSSENRRCIPMGFLDGNSVVSNSAYLVLNANPFDLGVLLSSMHMAWTRTVGGQLETRLRYSSSLCYNNFPFPKVTDAQRASVRVCALRILAQREEHSELSLDDLYEPEKMPQGLSDAHDALDDAVDRCYRAKPFTSAEERIIFLFKEFEEMTGTVDA